MHHLSVPDGNTGKAFKKVGVVVKRESQNRTPLPDANMEPAAGNEPLGAETLPRFDKAVHIHVTSYRKRKHDPDGISIKAVLDGLVAQGLLEDDSTDQIKSITLESRQSDEEKTVLEITDG